MVRLTIRSPGVFSGRKKRRKSSNNNTPTAAARPPTSIIDTTITIDSAETPLMTEEPSPTTESLSEFRDIVNLEAIRKERLEKRKLIDKRMLDFHEAVNNRFTQMENDAKNVDLGPCTRFGLFLVKAIHIIDATIGLFFVVYGSLILSQFDDPAIESAITSLVFGCVMIISSTMGVIGFTTKCCNRLGLLLSAYTAPFIIWFYAFVISSALVLQDVHFDYLTEHMSVMYLNADRIQLMINLLPLIYIIMTSLALVEGLRFFVMRTLYDNLIKVDRSVKSISTFWGLSDDASVGSSSTSSPRRRSSSISESFSTPRRRSNSISENLAQPLIENEEVC